MLHCDDRAGDRAKGEANERDFAALVRSWGYAPELHPADLPMWVDARVWPWPHLHEIKIKEPTRKHDAFGLEAYRLAELLRLDTDATPVFYTVRDTTTGAWLTVRVTRLPTTAGYRWRFPSYHGGRTDTEDAFLWPALLFRPLADLLAPGRPT